MGSSKIYVTSLLFSKHYMMHMVTGWLLVVRGILFGFCVWFFVLGFFRKAAFLF